jgi:predicted TIM-barrel fold metal-dependent hydrolase
MPIIDSDCHVIENEHTWSYMTGPDEQYRPSMVLVPDGKGEEQAYWNIEGRLKLRRSFDPARSGTTIESSDMTDVRARLSHMDELGVDIQILYPTVFLNLAFNRPEVEAAMCRGYNRWMASIWKAGEGRLGWVVMPPTMDMQSAIEELHFGKANGASGVFMRGMEQSKIPIDPHFFPMYEEASKLNLAICFHAGSASSFFDSVMIPKQALLWLAKVPVIAAFHSIVVSQLPEKFPDLRWGFVEVSASWVPYVMHDLGARFDRMTWAFPDRKVGNLMSDYRMFVACQTDDDLPYVLRYAGEDNLLIGSDYGHADTSSELEALRKLRESGIIPIQVVDKIMNDNPRRLYGI